jgi:hypothetical protein
MANIRVGCNRRLKGRRSLEVERWISFDIPNVNGIGIESVAIIIRVIEKLALDRKARRKNLAAGTWIIWITPGVYWLPLCVVPYLSTGLIMWLNSLRRRIVITSSVS